MKLVPVLLLAFSWALNAQAKAVFAHFMIGNTERYTNSDWNQDIILAKESHIDAFALNIAHGEATNTKSIADAFSHAETLNFKLLFSFDYAGRGAWPKEDVRSLIDRYARSPAYYRHLGSPLVTTFEGSANASDWVDIKASTGCFFVPDWSSEGAKAAMELAGGVADGLFSWAAWPWGGQDMDTYVDASYQDYLGGKPYMMPVSPWFYTNLPGFNNKNWLWRGDHLWYDRWEQVKYWQPEWVCIITWNDYGESHHIGPIRDNAMDAFKTGLAKYNYAHDHDGWRVLLPHQIDLYKYDTVKVNQEGVSFWYRPNPKNACPSGGTTVNTASQLQIEFRPEDILEDRIYYSVLVSSETDVVVTITVGGVATVGGAWRNKPAGGAGIYHGSVPFSGRTGPVSMVVMKGSSQIASLDGTYITNNCQEGIANYDAWAGGMLQSSSTSITTPSLATQVCVDGTGANNFKALCTFTCKYGYCPQGACVCTAMGLPRTRPKSTTVKGHPVAGLGSSFVGLCSFACEFGNCLAEYCGTVEVALTEPTVSPFLPPACLSGTGLSDGDFSSLCSYTCGHGFCPIALCTCTVQGALKFTPPILTVKASSLITETTGICQYGCERGMCPRACKVASITSPGTGVTVPDDTITAVTHFDQDCYRFPECVDMDNPQSGSCATNYTRVGHDQDACGNSGDNYGRPICCKKESKVASCIWRGNGPECNGQCHDGETHVLYSGFGGTPRSTDDNTSQCKRGYKFFCCQQPAYEPLTSDCYWSQCGYSCGVDEYDVATAWNPDGGVSCAPPLTGRHFCCPTYKKPLDNCHWVGQGDCADNTCNTAEIVLAQSAPGDTAATCNWGRDKALCCTPNDSAFDPPTCGEIELCAARDDPDFPCEDEWADVYNEDWEVPIYIPMGSSPTTSESHLSERSHQHSYQKKREKDVV